MRHYLIFSLLCLVAQALAQPVNPIMRYPDVSEQHIVFAFANDLWLVPKEGGLATKLSSPPGPESWAKFSPDGQSIAFTGNYDGTQNLYRISIDGGLPVQLTFHGMPERMIEWYPDGQHLLFASSMYSGKQRFNQFYKLPVAGGLPQALPIAHAEMGSISPDGSKIAFTDKTRLFRTWKRYRGGMAADLLIFDLNNNTSERISRTDSNDELPMWCGDKIYYLSDQGKGSRYNLWRYDLNAKTHRQVTNFEDWDVHFPSAGPQDIVFEAGGDLYLLRLADESVRRVEVRIVADFEELKPRQVATHEQLRNVHLSPDGKRVVAEARGELYSLPAEKGATVHLSQNSGAAERYPAWSPDGRSIAYWSDDSGEYDLYVRDLATGSRRKIAAFKDGYRYRLHWSPDSKKLAWIDQALNVQLVDIATGQIKNIARQKSMSHFGLVNFALSWSPDSRWLAFELQQDNRLDAIGLYHLDDGRLHTLSGGLYDLAAPVFDPDGQYLYVITPNTFQPIYSNFDNSFVYANSRRIGAFPLQKATASPLAPESDEVNLEKKEEKKEDGTKDQKPPKRVDIDLDGLAGRLVILPPEAGNYGRLAAAEGKIIYLKQPHSGVTGTKASLKYFDLKEREEKTIIAEADNFQLSADGKKLLVSKDKQMAIIEPAEEQKMEKQLDFSQMRLALDPAREWQQIFNDVWRFQRDFFYDKNMHGLDWPAVKKHYQSLLARACSRADVNYVLGEMIAELDASHAYRGGGDMFETERRDNVGYLGIDWEKQAGHYRIAKIVKAAPWDTEVRSPLAEPGVGIAEGDYILAVNGLPISTLHSPYAAFWGLAGKTVELTTNREPKLEGAKKTLVKTLDDETRLRNLAWIEANRQYVDARSGGRIGYVYVPSTGLDGQEELVRMFYGQYTKDALIIDERFNNGGQIPDRFIELLNRPPVAFWKTRDGVDWQWPPVAHFGPKAMLINGWSGSGGDAFPDYFRQAGLGPLVGSRTWGGLIGISGSPELVDGGSVTVPTFRMFYPDGQWFREGHGVDPDIEVLEDYTALAQGRDAQLDKAIELLLQALEQQRFTAPQAPPMEDRSGN
jgi:tricorn protease